MKKRIISALLATTLTAGVMLPTTSAIASGKQQVPYENYMESSTSTKLENLLDGSSMINNSTDIGDYGIEARGFNFSKVKIAVNWVKQTYNKVKKWVAAAVSTAETLKIAWDTYRAITVNKEYVGPGYYTSGEPVRTVQAALKERGYNVGTVDGKYGAQTKSAIQQFQRSKKLSADGIVGPQTWKVLFEK